jgi:membrane protein
MSAAPSAWQLGGLTVRELSGRVWRRTWEDEILDRAAALSYYFLFAIFPALLFVAALLSLVHVHHVMRQLMNYAAHILPGDAASTLRETVRQLASSTRVHGGTTLLVLSVALWIGSSGLASVMAALNVVYRVSDDRPWWKRRGIAIVLTVAFSVFLIVALALTIFGAQVGAPLSALLRLGPAFPMIWNGVTVALAVLFVLTGIALIYHFAPAVEHHWRWVTPGSITATALWLVASFGLRYYVGLFTDYSAYGSIGGLILLLLWLYLTSVVLLLGAEIDAEIERAAREGRSVSDLAADPRPR